MNDAMITGALRQSRLCTTNVYDVVLSDAEMRAALDALLRLRLADGAS